MNSLTIYFGILRPKHWLKNLMLFFPPFFGGVLFSSSVVHSALWPFAAFCLAASAIYIFNDIADAEKDSQHPRKRDRPIPSGAITKAKAATLGLLLSAAGIGLALWISLVFTLYLLAYAGLMLFYSFSLKQVAVLDIFCIAAGFLIRLKAGGVAFAVPVSEWLFITVFLLALFLSTGKRLSEKYALGELAGNHRPILSKYPDGFLEGAMFMTGAAVIVTYSIYVIDRSFLVYTVPLCCLGLFRYMVLVQSSRDGDPTHVLLKDPLLFGVSLLWAITIMAAIYHR